jgi:hypothetical protein
LKAFKGYNSNLQGTSSDTIDYSLAASAPTADGTDWVTKGMVTPIQN